MNLLSNPLPCSAPLPFADSCAVDAPAYTHPSIFLIQTHVFFVVVVLLLFPFVHTYVRTCVCICGCLCVCSVVLFVGVDLPHVCPVAILSSPGSVCVSLPFCSDDDWDCRQSQRLWSVRGRSLHNKPIWPLSSMDDTLHDAASEDPLLKSH